MLPRVGLNFVQVPSVLAIEAAVMAERLGYESLWLGEHVVVPSSIESAFPGKAKPFDLDSPFLEPLVALSHVAAATTTIRLGTSVLLLPARDLIFTARALVTLDVLSGGRLEVGAGVGWMREGFEATGRDFRRRGARMEEMLSALRCLFTESRPEFHGEFFDFPPIGFAPKPVRPAGPRFHLAGVSAAALSRAARRGDGWLGGSGVPLADMPGIVATLRDGRRAAGRQDEPFEISLLHYGALDRERLEELSSLGVERVIVTPWHGDPPVHPGKATSLEPIEAMAQRLGLAPLAAEAA
jgi:probable F420-dependent oxidoreductase